MSLLSLIIALVLIGVVMYLIVRFIPMEPHIKQLLIAVVLIILVLWIIQSLGLLAPLERIRIGR